MAMRCRCPPDRAHAPLADDGVVALGQRGDEVGGLRRLGRRPHLVHRGLGAAIGDVVAHGAREEERLLQHHADLRAQARQGHLAHVVSVDEHGAARHVVEARDEVDDGALARAGGAEEGHQLPRLDREAHPTQDLALAAGVAEAHVAKLHLAADRGQRVRPRRIAHLERRIEELEHAQRRDPGARDLSRQEAERHDGHEQGSRGSC